MPPLIGTFDVPVVRFFDEERYAIEFAETGRARFNILEFFHGVAGAKQDASEGVGRVGRGPVLFVRQGDKPVQAELEIVTKNPVYILCFSDATANLESLSKQFGRYMVQIDDPNVLNAALLDVTFEALPPGRTIANVRIGQVEYDKGAPRTLPNLPAAVPLTAFQKPACFAHEKEWRIAVKLSGIKAGAPDYLDATISMTQKLEIQRL